MSLLVFAQYLKLLVHTRLFAMMSGLDCPFCKRPVHLDDPFNHCKKMVVSDCPLCIGLPHLDALESLQK